MKDWISKTLMGVGLAVIILWAAGTLGIGHFVLAYGPHPVECIITK